MHAPEFRCLYIQKSEVIYAWGMDYLSWAFAKVESSHDPYAVNPISGARGLLQIMQPTIDEANRLAAMYGIRKKYTLDDAWSPEISVEIWQLLNRHHNPQYELDEACRLWFGNGTQYDGMTWREYMGKIKTYLNE